MDSPDLVAEYLARNLASLRHSRALTQGALAKAAAVPRSTIANLESGQTRTERFDASDRLVTDDEP